MAYCGPKGIPHSEFLTWPIDDQAKALGWQSEQNQVCNGCGTSGWEWERNRRAYTAAPFVCMGCMALEQGRTANEDQAKKTPGMQIRLTRNGGPDG